MTDTPTAAPADIRNEHRGAVSVGYHDPNALTRDQLIRLHAAQIAAQRLGPVPTAPAGRAVDVLVQAAAVIAAYITDAAAPVTPEDPR